MVNRGRRTLQAGLDQDIYTVIQKIRSEQEEAPQERLTVSAVYEKISRSNSSLRRRPARQLKDSIERVLNDFPGDDDESIDGDWEGIGEEPRYKEIPNHNIMNRTLTKTWGITPAKMPGSASDMSMHDRTISGEGESASKDERQSNGEPKSKRRKAENGKEDERKKSKDRSPPKGISFDDIGGIAHIIDELCELVAWPMLYPHEYLEQGIEPPRGILLHGPPGCGKTMLANALAAEVNVSFIPISAPSLIAGMSGESEKKIRDVFEEAKRQAPCLVFIDEIDVIMGKRESAQREMEKRIVAQMLTCMDDLALQKTGGKPVMIIAATNRPDSIDPALRRAGRFNREINLGVPNINARVHILRALTKNLGLPTTFDYSYLARLTPGFVGADLQDVVTIACTIAMRRKMTHVIEHTPSDDPLSRALILPPSSKFFDSTDKFRLLVWNASRNPPKTYTKIIFDDFLAAIPQVQPSAKREGFATIPDTTWAHVGALHSARLELTMAIVEPIKRPEIFAALGLANAGGVLLWGPPGCGKTLLAKAVANESKANFISIKGPELLNKYVGESERAVRQVFERARSSVPCIVFFDELDALSPRRDDSLSEASSKVVNTLLTELDGLSSRNGIYVVAATNRPDMIDPAMLRPGRLGKSIFVDLPSPDERVEILKTIYKNAMPTAVMTEETLSLLEIVARDERCEGYSGADLGSLYHAAGLTAARRMGAVGGDVDRAVGGDVERDDTAMPDFVFTRGDWEVALGEVLPSVKDMKKYRKLRERGM